MCLDEVGDAIGEFACLADLNGRAQVGVGVPVGWLHEPFGHLSPENVPPGLW
jgi:hypothetical protein